VVIRVTAVRSTTARITVRRDAKTIVRKGVRKGAKRAVRKIVPIAQKTAQTTAQTTVRMDARKVAIRKVAAKRGEIRKVARTDVARGALAMRAARTTVTMTAKAGPTRVLRKAVLRAMLRSRAGAMLRVKVEAVPRVKNQKGATVVASRSSAPNGPNGQTTARLPMRNPMTMGCAARSRSRPWRSKSV
jgi:hypothetical protein